MTGATSQSRKPATRIALTLLVPTLVLGLVGCGGGDTSETAGDAAATASPAPAPAPAPAASGTDVAQQYAPQLQVDLAQMTRSSTGLYTQDLAEGTGEPAATGQTVRVHYTGWLPDGQEFDSSRGNPYPVTLGSRNVIAGWEEGLLGMKQGGKRKLVIPSALAYGPSGRGPIPPDATLVFDVEVVEIR
jgi:peptidylprolyl isomerase